MRCPQDCRDNPEAGEHEDPQPDPNDAFKVCFQWHKAKYILFDSWFTMPKWMMVIKRILEMDVIAMVKKSSTNY